MLTGFPAYNTVEDRVHILETTSPSYTKRLGKLEESDKKLQRIVNEFNGVKKKLDNLKTSAYKDLEKKFQSFADGITKQSDGLSKKVDDIRPVDLTTVEQNIQDLTETTGSINEKLNDLATESKMRMDDLEKRLDEIPRPADDQKHINADVQTLLARVSKLESQSDDRIQLQSYSVNALAEALIGRLVHGDSVKDAALARLQELLPSTATSNGAQQTSSPPDVASNQTPESTLSVAEKRVPEKQSASVQRKRTIEQSHADDEGVETPRQDEARPRKRARGKAPPPRSSARKSLRSTQPPQTNELPNEEPQNNDIQKDADASTDDAPEEATEEEAPEIRRSARTPKPNKKHASFLTWIEVRDRRKTK